MAVAPGHAHLPAIKILHFDNFLPPRQIALRHYAIPFSNFIHRDYFPAKAPGHIVGWPRQVTQPHFIAGPLGVRQQAPKEHKQPYGL
jgi:hypothetical protein